MKDKRELHRKAVQFSFMDDYNYFTKKFNLLSQSLVNFCDDDIIARITTLGNVVISFATIFVDNHIRRNTTNTQAAHQSLELGIAQTIVVTLDRRNGFIEISQRGGFTGYVNK